MKYLILALVLATPICLIGYSIYHICTWFILDPRLHRQQDKIDQEEEMNRPSGMVRNADGSYRFKTCACGNEVDDKDFSMCWVCRSKYIY